MRRELSAFALLIAASAISFPAAADIIQVPTSSIQGDNVLFNSGTQTGTTVTGSTMSGIDVNFTGSTVGNGNVLRSNGGQARVEGAFDETTRNPNDTLLLTSLNFALDNAGTFNNLEFNVFGGTATAVNFALTDDMGTIFNFTSALGNGANMFGFVGITGQSIRSVNLSFTGGGVQDLRQIRLDVATAAGVPEPATWGLMILGLGMVGGALRRRQATAFKASFA